MKTKLKIWKVIVLVLCILALFAIYIFVVKDKAMTAHEIDSEVAKFEKVQLENAYTKNLSAEYLKNGAKEYMEIIGENTVAVNVLKDEIKTVGLRIAVMPVADVLDNEIYYFNKYGALMMYQVDLLGVGGSVKYYFSNGKLIEIKKEIEAEVDVQFENEKDIIDRADVVYNTFATKVLSK